MKRLLLPILLGLAMQSFGQQLPTYSSFQVSPYLFNPAVAGSEKYADIKLHYRRQWAGFDDGPRTQIASFHSSIDKVNFGIGGYFINDRTGISKQTSGGLTYAYHIPTGISGFISFGATARFGQYGIDGSKISVADADDLSLDLMASAQNSYFNADFGFRVGNEDWFFGVAAQNLLAREVALFNSNFSLEPHLNATGGFNLYIDDSWTLTPTALYQKTLNNPGMADVRAMLDYDELFQIGLGYRTSKQIAATAGFGITPTLNLFYTYDLTVSALRNANSGSHEIVLNYLFFYKPVNKGSRKRYKLNIKKSKV